ncbi:MULTISPECIES: hypothetical protein [unclassified Breznakia]|uniref:hypothetical protein n=1 Tax=unclassified Breznakia TaxID=2623764 RepID=UPI002477147B|nr:MULTISPECIES: hypothetical protein [unclassified Breznakia]MDH6367152.1 hypothetical protein [Breznakia sp. PH1-1]MDH6404261.1 hypothetical protein [Breznakia sp. PF1-11]MDH6412040.1 hypothetical protein [Breznakia sp. PFB1-11]MDH6414249.1 hypothetical protein [Breznakia sp. PFB1-14]MDH6416654.1 hypothetical protein [Breznakia sp. PFB1-4]
MKAINLLDDEPREVNEVDEVIKKSFSEAVYWFAYDWGTKPIVILEPTDEDISQVEYGHLYGYYKIGSEYFKSFGTASYEYIKKMKERIEPKLNEQLSLF